MVAASIFLPSYNKPGYVLDAIRSVLSQTSDDWELWLLENSTDGKTRQVIKQARVLDDSRIRYIEIDLESAIRKAVYPTTWILNRYYGQGNGEFFLFLADDDLLHQECVKVCAEHMAANPDKYVFYFSLDFAGASFGVPLGAPPLGMEPTVAECILSRGEVDCVLDSGQVAHRKSCLDSLEPPYFSESFTDARHCDGLFLERLAEHFLFHPIPQVLATHRFTSYSTWTAFAGGLRIPRGLSSVRMRVAK
jgi:hypothetical protein